MILNIETSGKICSVALCNAGDIVFHKESENEMEHARLLAPFVDECLAYLKRHDIKPQAVSVSIGPGSYTGLRIGLSLAKGISFGLSIPLIGVPTLEILAVKAMFKSLEWSGNELIVPMIDARRMEIYTAAYNFNLQPIIEPRPMVIDENSFQEIGKNKPLIFIGDCIEKVRERVKLQKAYWIDAMPLATDMNVLSEKAFKNADFLDIAYSVPLYLKNFMATTQKSKLD